MEPVPPPATVQKTPRVYESDIKEPDLTRQPKKSALKKTPVAVNVKKTVETSSVKIDFSTPVVRESPPPEAVHTAPQPSPKATPVNQGGPPRPKPRITLVR